MRDCVLKILTIHIDKSAKGQNTLLQFPRSFHVTSPQQVGNFPVYGEATRKRV